MAYYSSSNNYDEYHDNYQYHQPYNYNSHDELRYVQNYNYNNDYIEYNNNYNNNYNYSNNSYELTPTKSLVGYYYSNYSNNDNNNNDNYNGYSYNELNQHDFFASKNANFSKNGDYFYDPVTTRFIISHNNVNNNNNNVSNEIDDDLDFDEYDPEPFVGGYDICTTYGRPLPPSNDICYKVDTRSGTNDNQISTGSEKPDTTREEEGNKVVAGSGVEKDEGEKNIVQNVGSGMGPSLSPIPEGSVIDSEEDENEDEEEDEGVMNENVVPLVTQEVNDSKTEGTDEKSKGNNLEGDEVKIRRQIPPGCGIEAMGICDGLFGYFPCLSKKNYINCYECGSEIVKSKVVNDEYECWQGTVDYLFGNPNPYGGAMPEKGSYGDPVYAYQRHCPQMTVVGEFVNEETSSSVYSSGYNYGYNGDY